MHFLIAPEARAGGSSRAAARGGWAGARGAAGRLAGEATSYFHGVLEARSAGPAKPWEPIQRIFSCGNRAVGTKPSCRNRFYSYSYRNKIPNRIEFPIEWQQNLFPQEQIGSPTGMDWCLQPCSCSDGLAGSVGSYRFLDRSYRLD